MTKAAIPDQIRSAATLLGITDRTFVRMALRRVQT